jgi:uncharacterized peroxidase-related enzyme
MSVVKPLPKEKASPDVHDLYDKLTKGNGFMPAFFSTMAHRPDVFKNFVALYTAAINQGTVEPRYKELAYLKTARINGCEYCTRAHVASGKRHGITEEQLAAIDFFMRSPQFDEKDKATLLYAERVTRGASGLRERALEELSKYYTEDQIVELTLVICVANFTNRFNDALQIQPDLGV